MSSLALFLQDLGHFVEGSDVDEHYFTEDELKRRLIPIHPFSTENIDGKSIYIVSTAYKDNEETKFIIEKEYQYYYFHTFIGSLYYKKIIAISGTHGKTTTTKMLARMLKKLDVSYLIGSGEGYGSDKSKELVVEACEYQNHFLTFNPYVAIINNIELDHPDFYKNIKEVIKSFQDFAKTSVYLIINGDDYHCQKIEHPHKITYGLEKDNMVRGTIINEDERGYQIKINYLDEEYLYNLPFTGRHMIYNFLAAFSYLLKFEPLQITDNFQDRINHLEYPKRRSETYKYENTILINDYAHHPTEIKSLLSGLKQKYKDYQINALFQPHTYSRTLKFKKDFKKVLNEFDQVFIQNTFTSKREEYSNHQEQKVRKIFNKYQTFNKQTIETIKKSIKENQKTIWLFLGAGTIDHYMKEIIKEIDEQEKQ